MLECIFVKWSYQCVPRWESFHQFSNHGLQPPEIIDLHTEQRIGELLTKVFPDHHSLDILRVRAFARSEPNDVSSDYVELEASKGAFIQALWMPNPAYTVWHIRLGNDRVRKT
ncbi:hypothetical protein TNCV_3491471 [Trichonephila clavipes]|nr:hypothetical protein TNCV_3491471 [Trichonephila clavipes]